MPGLGIAYNGGGRSRLDSHSLRDARAEGHMPILTILVAAILAAGPGPEATAADAVTLRDGKVVLGQLVEPTPRGKILLVVRREWAEAHVPDLFPRWQAAETPWLRRARSERL